MARLYLAHHADALPSEADALRPLSPAGRAHVERLAGDAAARGVKPDVVWHSGKLRARQTAEAYWRACNALAPFSAQRDLQPSDPPAAMRDRLRGEARDVLIAGHFPHLARLLALLLNDEAVTFPPHGLVALVSDDEGESWKEEWRLT